ncbi:SGNH/GDSL hydrolase family protein [Nocardioides sp. LML1-1-1.1]|uniref:SGNH/GDSL hydrolase family protein n=1 Tax=Nocardioides sp. LML1-1-1.1 TaxID=3135248 RepID=UPI0034285815
MSAWHARMAAGCALVLALAACTSDDKPDASGNKRPVEAGDTYVALGDSYTSAPGVGAPTGPAGCLQTDGNYPHLLAAALDLELTDASCGGAKTENMTTRQQAGGDSVRPQLDAVTKTTDLVTLSIGANNGEVYGSLVITCAQLAVGNPTGAPCSDLAQQNPDVLPKIFDEVGASIVEIVGEILERAPKARVVVVGYPQIIPATGTCPELPLGAGDYPFGRGVIEQFVEAQRDAAAEAGAEYVDVWTATEGHDICGEEPWIAGVRPTRNATAYHPYAEEQQAVADLVEETVSGPGA